MARKRDKTTNILSQLLLAFSLAFLIVIAAFISYRVTFSSNAAVNSLGNRYNLIVKAASDSKLQSWDYNITSTRNVLCNNVQYAAEAYIYDAQFNSTNLEGIGCSKANLIMNETSKSDITIWKDFGSPENIIGVFLKTATNPIDLYFCREDCEGEWEVSHCNWTYIKRFRGGGNTHQIDKIIQPYPSGTYLWFQEATGNPLVTCE